MARLNVVKSFRGTSKTATGTLKFQKKADKLREKATV